ncbi:MAG: T9SS type A sorting domain-containing protein, partial [Candidatus Neomarinimicrobiota bacterium]|nr:T9SS type A sorting domain-containing protein [Candidatus Neomarinimicrobiota bacterium]
SDSTVSIPVTLEQTENLSAGTYTGYLYFGTNTGADPGVIVSNTDTVTVTLNLMSDGTLFADTTVTVAAGNSEPIDITDESGQSMGIMVDFEHSDGGSVMVQSIGLQPPMDETPLWVDPDGLITDPAFPNKYFEISTDITGDYWVDIGLDYTMLPGIYDPQSLRLAKRPGYAGASEPWTVIAVASTEINSTDGLVVAKNQTSFSQWAMISNASDNSFIDTDGPVISNFALTPAQPNILEEVTVTADLADGTGIAAATLYYMAGGSSGYTSVEMATTGGSYSGTIPGSAVSMAGLFYYMVAIDLSESSYTTSSDTIGIPVNFAAGSLTTSSATGSAYPSGLPLDKWRLISIPAVLDETGVGLVIGDELGTQDDNIWRMFDYDKSTSSYKANPVDFTVGESYWLYQRVEDNLTVSTPAGETGNMSGTTLTIAPGWNFIGSPYPFSLPLALDQVQFYGPITYGLTGQSWSSVVPELDPWNGYAVYNRTVSDKTIVLDPGSAGAGLAARTLDQEEGWLMTLQVSTEEYQDRFNTIGALLSAHDDRDWHDNPEITAPGRSVSLFFTIPDEEVTYEVTSDVRALDGRLKAWDARIRAKDLQGATELSWTIDQVLETGQAVQLVDLSARSVVDMLHDDRLDLGTVYFRYDRQIKIISGEPEQVALAVDEILAAIPEELSLEGNYPNPFNPVTTIRFGLPEPRRVSLTIVNMLGQEVAELLNGWKDLGHHEIRWQSLDNQGVPVASGVYFAVLRDGSSIDVRKMILLK